MGARRHARFVLILGLFATGCINMQMYFQPKLAKVADDELPHPEKPIPVRLEIVYEINGTPDPKWAQKARSEIAAAAERTKVFDVVAKADRTLRLHVSDKFDEAEAYTKAQAAGSSFGAAGSITPDEFAYSVEITRDYGMPFRTSGQTTMNMILGNRSVPDDYEPMGFNQGQRALFDMIFRTFARDAYRAGAI